MHTEKLALAKTLLERALIERGVRTDAAERKAAAATYSMYGDAVLIEADGHRAVAVQPAEVAELAKHLAYDPVADGKAMAAAQKASLATDPLAFK